MWKPRNLEEAIYLGQFRDGLMDVLFGAMAFLIGTQLVTHDSVSLTVGLPVAFIMTMLLRRRFVEPRMGQVKLVAGRQKALDRLELSGKIIGLGLIPLGILVFFYTKESGGFAAVTGLPKGSPFAAFLLMASLVTGLVIPLRRFLVYALLVAVASGLALAGIAALSDGLRVAGLVPMLSGLVMLATFIHQNPEVSEPESEGEA